jgi:ABC-type nickel/cobalt efflux system permease component RcnA
MSTETRTSAFDIRLIIALLTGVYGIILTVLGLFVTSGEEIDKSAGVNINLWTGLALLVLTLLFGLWARLRPLRVPVHHDDEEAGTPQ